MSLWFQHKDQLGKTHYRVVPFAPGLIVMLIGLTVALLLPAVQAVKDWLDR